MRELDEVSKDLAPLRSLLISAVILIALGGLVNIAALGLYYAHVQNLPVLVVIRIILGICGIAVVSRGYGIIRKVQDKYKSPV